MEEIQNDLNCFFFQNGEKNNDKALISIKMLLFLETVITSCANVPTTRYQGQFLSMRKKIVRIISFYS